VPVGKNSFHNILTGFSYSEALSSPLTLHSAAHRPTEMRNGIIRNHLLVAAPRVEQIMDFINYPRERQRDFKLLQFNLLPREGERQRVSDHASMRASSKGFQTFS
jgi:hypothetical protein